MVSIRPILLLAVLAVSSSPALGHGGGTNAEGCHTNRSTGAYHCHGRKASASSAPRPAALYGAQPVGSSSTSYANCSEARQAGAAPVRRGDAGYGTHLDRDGDGVGCE